MLRKISLFERFGCGLNTLKIELIFTSFVQYGMFFEQIKEIYV
jgi:hypothetical protein